MFRSPVHGIELGKSIPTVDNILALARLYKKSLKEILTAMDLDVSDIPDDCPKNIEQRIINTAVKLDGVRQLLGDRPIHVNSWYRPAHINKKVGGSKYSRHQFGDAVDIRSDYLNLWDNFPIVLLGIRYK